MTLHRLDALQLDNVLKTAGFTNDEDRRIAWALAMRESSGYYDVIGGPNGNGTYDYGLFQINELHKNNENIDWSLVLTAAENAKFAYYLTKGGHNYSAWGLPNDDGTVTGYAASLKKNSPETFDLYYSRWKKWYDAYPSSLAAAKALQTAGVVSLVNLRKWTRNADIKDYQLALRIALTKWVGSATVNTLNPSGATGYFGDQTIAMTKRAYLEAQKRQLLLTPTNNTVPNTALCKVLGLTVI